MMRALLTVRFRALLAGLVRQTHRKKKPSAGMTVLFAVLYLYLIVIACGTTSLTFLTLVDVYHPMGLDWLYFAIAALGALGISVFGSVFTTQSQLYDAKDNGLLLSMPVTPSAILISRMVPLLSVNLLFGSIVMVPAAVVYAIKVGFSFTGLLAQLVTLIAVMFLAQAIACLLGWLLHLLLNRMNKSLASMLYMIAFLAAYFYISSQANTILNSMAVNAEAIAGTLKTWIWPLYAAGLGCTGGWGYLAAFAAISAAVFCLVWVFLSVTFLHSATMQRSRRKRKLELGSGRSVSPAQAIIGKEWRKFLGCPVYLTNMGLGILLTAALPIAGVIFRSTLLELTQLPFIAPLVPLLLCAILAFTISTMAVSTPSVSLEGKNIWILKSMPVASRDILVCKLRFHCRATVPVSMAAGLILAAAFGCGIADCLLVALVPGLLAVLNGLVGMIAGLKWARLDYISEAYPCKQSVSVLVSMFGIMGVPLVLGLVYILLLMPYISATVFLVLCAAVLALACCGLYRVMVTWGCEKWDSL